ncbi:unnamed protein product [Strongylus vulgaris]|uniref:Uncharacterized protein n=1 Tax=Strongylus vulgaris TaxID=40348 RepID=A0A3P7J8W9_STRVU|nr:unnamed protein product [Strongylus vulgaris]
MLRNFLESGQEGRDGGGAAYLLHGYSGHGIYPATSPQIYKFIPTNVTEITKPKAKMYEAGFVFAVRTKDTVEQILKWYVLCALEEKCMAGNGMESLVCIFTNRFSGSPQCHRYVLCALEEKCMAGNGMESLVCIFTNRFSGSPQCHSCSKFACHCTPLRNDFIVHFSI